MLRSHPNGMGQENPFGSTIHFFLYWVRMATTPARQWNVHLFPFHGYLGDLYRLGLQIQDEYHRIYLIVDRRLPDAKDLLQQSLLFVDPNFGNHDFFASK